MLERCELSKSGSSIKDDQKTKQAERGVLRVSNLLVLPQPSTKPQKSTDGSEIASNRHPGTARWSYLLDQAVVPIVLLASAATTTAHSQDVPQPYLDPYMLIRDGM